jgi:hypothetical protein
MSHRKTDLGIPSRYTHPNPSTRPSGISRNYLDRHVDAVLPKFRAAGHALGSFGQEHASCEKIKRVELDVRFSRFIHDVFYLWIGRLPGVLWTLLWLRKVGPVAQRKPFASIVEVSVEADIDRHHSVCLLEVENGLLEQRESATAVMAFVVIADASVVVLDPFVGPGHGCIDVTEYQRADCFPKRICSSKGYPVTCSSPWRYSWRPVGGVGGDRDTRPAWHACSLRWHGIENVSRKTSKISLSRWLRGFRAFLEGSIVLGGRAWWKPRWRRRDDSARRSAIGTLTLDHD